MVGDSGGAYSAALHNVVDRLGIADRIRLLPVTPDTNEWYLAADAFILGSDVESLPRSMLEAMAFGVPVLGSAVFGVPELIDDGVNGLLFEPSSARDAENVLRRFLQLSANERRSLGVAGQKLVESTRSSDIYAGQYRDLLTALVDDPNVLPKVALFGLDAS
jgi:glycosyltransferase involved in cell wall biosynthesis